jgi:hypothetical protein
MYINGGALSLPNIVKNHIAYSWLGPIEYVDDTRMQFASMADSEVPVYNLWLDGDSSYIINGIPTTSILEDTRFLRNIIKYNYSTHDQCMDTIEQTTKDINLMNGSYAVSKILGSLDSRILDRIVAKIFNDGKISKKVLFGFLKIVGSLVVKKK